MKNTLVLDEETLPPEVSNTTRRDSSSDECGLSIVRNRVYLDKKRKASPAIHFLLDEKRTQWSPHSVNGLMQLSFAGIGGRDYTVTLGSDDPGENSCD